MEWTYIDWTKLALVGHSLGGYTVLGLAGAWPDWKLGGVGAIIALSPYSNPYIENSTLAKIDVPVMYQSGTRDKWINTFVKKENGAYSQTPSPSIYIELENANHFAWTNLNKDSSERDLISHYCVEFLNKYVLGVPNARPEEKLAGVSNVKSKVKQENAIAPNFKPVAYESSHCSAGSVSLQHFRNSSGRR